MTKRQTIFAIICLILALTGTRNADAQDKPSYSAFKRFPCPASLDEWIILVWTLKVIVYLLPHWATVKIPWK
jgi:hypothetical protein